MGISKIFFQKLFFHVFQALQRQRSLCLRQVLHVKSLLLPMSTWKKYGFGMYRS